MARRGSSGCYPWPRDDKQTIVHSCRYGTHLEKILELYRKNRPEKGLTIVPFGTWSTRSNLPYLISFARNVTAPPWSEGILGSRSPDMRRVSFLSRCTLTSSDFKPGSSSTAVMRDEDGSSHNSSL